MTFLHNFIFGLYPYICLSIFLVGSLMRFYGDPYSWKSDSSQLLRAKQLRWGSILFHVGILFLLFGHLIGLLTPHAVYEYFISPANKQLLAIITGGTSGCLCFIGLTMLLHRRLTDDRIFATSKISDLLILVLLWCQLLLGLLTIPLSTKHLDGSLMIRLSEWAQHIVWFRGHAADYMYDVHWAFQLHIFLGMTIFLIFPFTRLVHIWSGFSSIAYLARPYQIVRSKLLK